MLLPCQLTTTASLRVLLQHCWQDPGCVPCKCSIVGAGHGQELLFNCSKEPPTKSSLSTFEKKVSWIFIKSPANWASSINQEQAER
ncbi:uncharacterized protein LOC110436674 isoform X3 [Sorghum bicolor]|uniref:Uncharacterized protein n=1 Tax=Sorghum bicolor TaxID=4558 RepID=A0A1B6PKL1_SORBI|nr:uncharacterized protein LOC110436674 isoform X3 [Sorghum bicolor]KXG26210.1 hypothetical protein SORBI_3006G066000 [Sorghum bicolor]OQU81490.1 hypothetical protein SORBI_3006G066000 [Sorghum bicolor]OQU81491.1 hypothetical protein SORBI_3006G066000 [Sorghum bicolor]|eukprot:XP_021319808.1 uncharacterized protein LOC110436674 isoform X3 [Sorghum bicolor]